MCHFPFKYMNTTYTSCSHTKIPNFNLQSEPWCATEVESDGITVKEYKWSLCQDERGLILDGEGKIIFLSFHVIIHLTKYRNPPPRKVIARLITYDHIIIP